MRSLRSLEVLATLEVRPLWAKLMALSTASEEGQLDRRAEEALAHRPSQEVVVML